MSFGDGDLHVIVAQLKTENARLRQQVDKLRELPEIVRCRDCENYEYRDHLGRSYCCGEYATEPDGFCAWGERRGE